MKKILVVLSIFLYPCLYSLSNPFVTSDGVVIEDFEDLSGWALQSANTTQTTDLVNFTQGTQGLRFNIANNNAPFTDKSGLNYDFSNTVSIRIDVWLDTTSIANFYIYLFNDATKYFTGQFVEGKPGVYGWHRYVAVQSDFTASGGMTWSDTVSKIRLKPTIFGTSGTVTMDNLCVNYDAKPVIIFRFDDGYQGQHDTAAVIMAANSQKGNVMVVPAWVGTGTKIDTDSLTNLYNAGWDICNHSYDHPNDLTLIGTAIDTELSWGQTWLTDNGFNRGYKFFSYPGGNFNDTVVQKVKENHTMSSNSVVHPNQAHIEFDGWAEHNLKTYNVDRNIANTQVACSIIDTFVLQRKGLMVMLFHNVQEVTASSSDCTASLFQAISDHIKTYEDAGQVDVLTFTEYYNAYFPSGGIVYIEPNKKRKLVIY